MAHVPFPQRSVGDQVHVVRGGATTTEASIASARIGADGVTQVQRNEPDAADDVHLRHVRRNRVAT